MDAFKNFAYSMVIVPPVPPNLGTSLTVPTGHSARFPAPPFNVSVWPKGLAADPSNAEIVRVVGVTGDLWTIQRQQEGSYARAIERDDQIAQALTLKAVNDLKSDAQAAAQTWVNNQAFATQAWVTGRGYATTAQLEDRAFAWASQQAQHYYNQSRNEILQLRSELYAGFLQIAPRVEVHGSVANIFPNVDTTDLVVVDALTQTLGIQNPTGTPRNGQDLLLRIRDGGTAQVLGFGTLYFPASNMPLPTTTAGGGMTIFMDFRWNSWWSHWNLVNLVRA